MNNFGYVLLIGVAIFIVGGILAGVDTGSDSTPINDTDEDAFFNKDIGFIGDLNVDSRTAFQRNDLVIEHRSPNTTVESFDEFTIKKGAFAGEESQLVRVDARQPEAIYVEFTVADASPSAPLRFIVNGHEEASITPQKGKSYTVKIENVTEGRNNLLLETDNPGARFWSSTSYTLQDVDVILKDRAVEKNTQSFRVYPYEIDGFDTGQISYLINEDVVSTAPMRIDINGQNIETRRPVAQPSPYEISFSKAGTNLRPGENTISFYTEPGASYTLSNVNLEIQHFTSTQRGTITEKFDIPTTDYQFIGDDGIIRFRVRQIGVREPVTMTLNERTYEFTPESGINTLQFSKDDVNSGQNTLQISTSGSYEITGLTVTAE